MGLERPKTSRTLSYLTSTYCEMKETRWYSRSQDVMVPLHHVCEPNARTWLTVMPSSGQTLVYKHSREALRNDHSQNGPLGQEVEERNQKSSLEVVK